MLVLLVRHGVTPTTGTILPGRAPGLHLSADGVAQADKAARRVAALAVTAIHTSPLERAVETAAPTAGRLGLTPVADQGLLECDFGHWTGRALGELSSLPEWQVVQRDPASFRFPGGESFVELQDRMVAALDRIAGLHPQGVVACFSHADPIKAVLSHALGGGLDAFQRLWVSPASVSALEWEPGGTRGVRLVNSTTGSLRDLRPA